MGICFGGCIKSAVQCTHGPNSLPVVVCSWDILPLAHPMCDGRLIVKGGISCEPALQLGGLLLQSLVHLGKQGPLQTVPAVRCAIMSTMKVRSSTTTLIVSWFTCKEISYPSARPCRRPALQNNRSECRGSRPRASHGGICVLVGAARVRTAGQPAVPHSTPHRCFRGSRGLKRLPRNPLLQQLCSLLQRSSVFIIVPVAIESRPAHKYDP